VLEFSERRVIWTGITAPTAERRTRFTVNTVTTKRKRFSIPEQSTKGPFQRDMVEKKGNVGFKPEEKVKERTRGDLRHTTQSWWQEGKRGRINVILRPTKHAMLPYMYSVVLLVFLAGQPPP
jgi:hypothetical protein